jgi:hypothetical protein
LNLYGFLTWGLVYGAPLALFEAKDRSLGYVAKAPPSLLMKSPVKSNGASS